MGENISEHIIPIYDTASQPTNNRGIQMLRKIAIPYMKLNSNLSERELRETYVESMRIAKERINAGGLVVIFPDGPGGRGSEWKNGVGDIVTRSKNPDLNVIFAYTEPNEKWKNRARVVTTKAGRLLGPTTVTVDFSEPHSVSEYLGNRKHNVTQMLKEQYEEFVAAIKLKT